MCCYYPCSWDVVPIESVWTFCVSATLINLCSGTSWWTLLKVANTTSQGFIGQLIVGHLPANSWGSCHLWPTSQCTLNPLLTFFSLPFATQLVCPWSKQNTVRKVLCNHLLNPTANPFHKCLLGTLFCLATSIPMENRDISAKPIQSSPILFICLSQSNGYSACWGAPSPAALMQHPLQSPREQESECLWFTLLISRLASWVGSRHPHAACFFLLVAPR